MPKTKYLGVIQPENKSKYHTCDMPYFWNNWRELYSVRECVECGQLWRLENWYGYNKVWIRYEGDDE